MRTASTPTVYECQSSGQSRARASSSPSFLLALALIRLQPFILCLHPDDLVSSSLPIHRGILLQHSRALPSSAKKADLVSAFVDTVLPLKKSVLKAQSKVKSSSAGITIMGQPNLGEPVVSCPRSKERKETQELTLLPSRSSFPVSHPSQQESTVCRRSSSGSGRSR